MKKKSLVAIVSVLFSLLWISLVVYNEHWVFAKLPSACLVNHASSGSKINTLIIADPQLTDWYSYAYMRTENWKHTAVSFFSDIFMKKSFSSLISNSYFDAIVFLGDLMDGGRYLTSDQFSKELNRFSKIFSWPASQPAILSKTGNDKPSLIYTVAGNHDIGYKQHDTVKHAQVYSRFKSTFPPHLLNYDFTIGNTQYVVINSVALEQFSNMDSFLQEQYTEAWQFIDKISQNLNAEQKFEEDLSDIKSLKHEKPAIVFKVLYTHVPLFRSASSSLSCGKYAKLRNNNKGIQPGGGVGYQNTLSRETSLKILNLLQPDLILSGDDHDMCEFFHEYGKGKRAKEITIGTFSWTQGTVQPSAAILSVDQSVNQDQGLPQDHLTLEACLLPRQIPLFLNYLVLFGISAPFLILYPLYSYTCAVFQFWKNHKLDESSNVLSKNSGVSLHDYDLEQQRQFAQSSFKAHQQQQQGSSTTVRRGAAEESILPVFNNEKSSSAGSKPLHLYGKSQPPKTFYGMAIKGFLSEFAPLIITATSGLTFFVGINMYYFYIL